MLYDVYGEEALKDRQSRNWFDNLRSRNFSLKHEQCSGRPNNIQSRIASKKRLCCLFVGIGKVWIFWAASMETNDLFGRLASSAEKI